MSHSNVPSVAPGHAHTGAGPHVVSFRLLLTIFIILMFLTFATVGATYIDLGYTGNLVLCLVIAVIKAALVMLYFMHLRWDSPFNAMMALAALLFMTIFIVACITDTGQYKNNYVRPGTGSLMPR